MLFNASDVSHGTELWVTNGLPAGTYLLKDINPGATSGFITHQNGTSDTTSLRAVGNAMIFLADDGTHGQELWVTDGTSAGTSILKDIDAGSQPSNPIFMAPFGNRMLFSAFDGLHAAAGDGLTGQELWVTDGTAAGTSLVADLDPGIFGSLAARNTSPVWTAPPAWRFSAKVGNVGRELWVTDGTSGGTSLIKDINPGAYKPSNPSTPVSVGTTGLAVFAAVGPSNHASKSGGTYGTELWVTDGTSGGTSLLKTFSEGYSDGGNAYVSNTANGTMATLGNEVLFTGSDGGKTALWGTDGTVNGTVKLSTDGVFVDPLGGTGRTGFTTMASGKDLFWNGTGIGAAPWVTDGTPGGTFQLATVNTNLDQGESFGFALVGNKAVFNAVSPGVSTHDLWVTDGTKAGTYDIGVSALSNPKNFGSINGKVIFQGTDSTHGTELWITDGTFLGTKLLKDINTTYAVQFSSSNPATITGVSLACFAAGTRIRMPDGEMAVEALREGDVVVTASGEERPVRWIGHRAVDVAHHPRPEDVSPVRIAPHAFGEGLPHAALFLSPDHAIFVDDVLMRGERAASARRPRSYRYRLIRSLITISNCPATMSWSRRVCQPSRTWILETETTSRTGTVRFGWSRTFPRGGGREGAGGGGNMDRPRVCMGIPGMCSVRGRGPAQSSIRRGKGRNAHDADRGTRTGGGGGHRGRPSARG